MNQPNFKPATVWIGDNLEIMRGMNSGCVDLIYLDPPFNSNRNYEAPVGGDAVGSFKDVWHFSDLKAHEHGELADRHPGLYKVIEAAGAAHGEPMMAYLIMMGVRLLEMKRLLKDTGSIYLHVDPTASHYLKLVMDCVFGRENYRNHLTWKRSGNKNDKTLQQFGAVSDHILFYGQPVKPGSTMVPLSAKRIKDYKFEDARGKWCNQGFLGSLTGQGAGQPKEWKGVDPISKGRHWSVPKTGRFADFIEEHIPGYLAEQDVIKRLDLLEQNDFIFWNSSGLPVLKRYLTKDSGQPLNDFWGDISMAQGNERTGYPTQKPEALLERIIKASSNPGDLVFDPFCGCATTLVAANNLNRNWVGCDLSETAVGLVKQRMDKVKGMPNSGLFTSQSVITLKQPPVRTDLDAPLPDYKSQKHLLFSIQKGVCAGCHENHTFRVLTVDHIVPQSKGGQDDFDNLQLMCGPCNSSKGKRLMAVWLAERDPAHYPLYNPKFNPRRGD